ncbi:DUF7289 family protein [Salinibaculum salinum]|uniref:DUF7289 family protein n=1 Tax=Salinibaculum salinum TaxID=3131996 RepID=UPI0030EB7789
MVSSEVNRGSHLSRLSDGRAQSSTIGVALVFGFVIVGSVLIVALGTTALGDAQQNLGEDRAEKALTQFDSKTALVALGNTDTQRVTFGQGSSNDFNVKNGTGWMRITIDNQTDSSGPKTLLNQSMGSVVYENERTTLAYQGGGVWRQQSDNSQMISPPEFHFRNGTLTLPVVNVTGEQRLRDSATITHKRTTKQFPNTTKDKEFENPLTEHRVKVTVQSDYYRGWGNYFEERTTGEVEYDHDRDIVNLTLVTPFDKNSVSSASASLAASGDFILQGSAAEDCRGNKSYSNSYNSSASGDYCSQPVGVNGDIVYGGDVDIESGTGGSNIYGDVVSGEIVTVSGSGGTGQVDVYGNINYTVDCKTSGGGGRNPDCTDRIISPDGELNQIDDVESVPDISRVVNDTVYRLKDSNDNSGAPISSDRLDFSSNEVTLTAGEYYVEKIDFDGDEDKINFDTSGGNITIAVRGDVEMPSGSDIEVTGGNNTKMYVNGESAVSDGDGWTFDMNGDTDVTVEDSVASNFRVYGQEDFKFRINSGENHKFTGVIFAPPGQSGSGEVEIASGHVRGGILTGTTTISNSGSIHYDEALQNKRIISQSAQVVTVTYLHVSINEVEVTD